MKQPKLCKISQMFYTLARQRGYSNDLIHHN